MIRVGSVLHGYCGGAFGRDSYNCKRVEAIGADWIVVRYIKQSESDAACGPNILGTLEEYLQTASLGCCGVNYG